MDMFSIFYFSKNENALSLIKINSIGHCSFIIKDIVHSELKFLVLARLNGMGGKSKW